MAANPSAELLEQPGRAGGKSRGKKKKEEREEEVRRRNTRGKRKE